MKKKKMLTVITSVVITICYLVGALPNIMDETDFMQEQMIVNAEECSDDNADSDYSGEDDGEIYVSENNIIYDNPQRPVYLVAADSAGFSVKDGVYTINHTADICDGVSVKVNCSVSNLVLHNDSDSNHTEVYVTGDLEADCSVIADFNEIFSGPTTITLGYVNVAGVGALTLSLNVNLDGKLTVKYDGSFKIGVYMDSGHVLKTISSYTSKGKEVTVEANARIGLTLAFEINLTVFKGKISGSIGFSGKYISNTFYDGVTPNNCSTASAYLYANVSAEAKIGIGIFSKTYSRTFDIYTAENSPVKLYYHWEDGVRVDECKRGIDITSDAAWILPAFSEPFGIYGESGGSDEPYSIFEYETIDDSDSAIKITGYRGNVKTVEIPETIDGYTVVEIAENAFEGNSIFTKVTMPDTITKIGKEAFYNCKGMTEIDLSDNIATIDDRAFADCTALSGIFIPKSLTECGINNTSDFLYEAIYDYINNESGIFINCSALKNVTFEDGIRKIPKYLFVGCTGLREVTIPETVIEIEDAAFFWCNNLKKVTMSDNLTTIGNSVFSGCRSLTDITFSQSLNYIGQNAFWGSAFTTLNLPDSVETIMGGAFRDCPNLSQVHLSSSLKTMGSYVFGNCDSLTNIFIPKSLEEVISEYNFYNGGLTVYWKYGIFDDCDNLTDAEFEEGMTVIPKYIFRDCNSLERVIIPSTTKKIDDEAFLCCLALDNVILNDGLEAIGYKAFYECSSLSEIIIPDTVTLMNTLCFDQCSSLKKAVLPNTRVYINNYTFRGCTSLESVVIPDTVEYIEEGAFEDCASLKSIDLPDGVKTIEKYAFKNCSSLEEFTVPKYASYIGSEAFSGCKALEKLTMSNNVKTLDGTQNFYGCESLKEVTLSENIEIIPEQAFSSCYELKSIRIPYNCLEICTKAFENTTALTDIYIGEKTTYIADTVFSYPRKLTIHGVTGSEAESYANLNNITFVADYLANDCTMDINSAIVNNIYETYEYTGKAIMPHFSVTHGDTLDRLEEGTDYEIRYMDNVDVGTAKIIIKGIGLYTGEKTVTFEIISDEQITTTITTITSVSTTTTELTEATAITTTSVIIDTEEGRYGDLYYEKTDTDSDGIYDSITISSCNTSVIKVDIPDKIEDLPVTAIGSFAFFNCSSLNNVTFGKNVTEIHFAAFTGCTNLKSIIIPQNVSSFIGKGAFEGCLSLTDIIIENPYCEVYDDASTIADTATIYGYENSTAQAYAKKYGRNFISLGEAPVITTPTVTTTTASTTQTIVTTTQTTVTTDIPDIEEIETGDANLDGKLNVRDAAFIASALAKGLANTLPENADYNGDGKVNVRDAAAIASYLAKRL